MKFTLIDLPAFIAVFVAVYLHFGLSYAIGAMGVLWLLAPYYVTGSVATPGRFR